MFKRLTSSWLNEVYALLILVAVVAGIGVIVTLVGGHEHLQGHLDQSRFALQPAHPLPAGVAFPANPEVTVQMLHPTLSDHILQRVAAALTPALFFASALLMLRIVRSARHGDPFDPDNGRRLRTLAILIAGGGMVVELIEQLVNNELLLRSAAKHVVIPPTFNFALIPIFVGFIVLAIAEVFARGTRLRDEVEGLV